MLISWNNIILTAISLGVLMVLIYLVKLILHSIRRPNGKKGGIVSLRTSLAISLVTIIALITKDWFLTLLSSIIAYIVIRDSYMDEKHKIYQIGISILLGIAIPISVWYVYNTKFKNVSTSLKEEYKETAPDHYKDDRRDADNAPELKLDD